MMKYLYTNPEHYKLFLEKNKINNLSKGLKITPFESKIGDLLKYVHNYKPLNEEIFDRSIETEYILQNIKQGKKAVFKTNSNTEYRLDIYPINEKDQIINHISFTINDDKFDNMPNSDNEWNTFNTQYNILTGKEEIYEILNRLHFILKDLVDKKIITNYFCIGGTELERKNRIYEYFLKVVVGKEGFEKLETKVYPKIGWGLYFKI